MGLPVEETEVDPANLPPTLSVTWSANTRPGHDQPGHTYAARLLASTVDHLKVAGEHAQQRLVPAALSRLELLVASVLEDQLPPSAVLRIVHQLHKEISADLHVLAAEINADARKTLHRRMMADLAVTLIPRLDGGAQ